jgi:zinc finger protein 830
MADVRALLKAKRQEARISHPYATYTTAGQLKCTVCGAVVKHASAWEGHLGSKLHRTNVVRMREEERRQRELQEQQARAHEEEEEEEEETVERAPKADTAGKRKAAAGVSETPAEKKRKVEAQPKGFPQDFFSDPSRAPASLLSPASDEEDEGEDAEAPPAAPLTTSTSTTVVDLEYERFQRELLMSSTSDPTETYARATVAAEPVPASAEIAGFPPTEPEAAEPEPPKLTEDEIRRKREEDERELIMDRLLEEERAQEDADTRVLLLKTKLDNLRRKRELAKASKAPK